MTAYYNENDPHCAEWLRNLIKAGEIAPGDVDERDVRDVTPAELMGYTQCHFFAGIGGWSRALRLAGWPDDRPVWTGSCPCQSFSAAGRGGGFADERHLWPYWFHLIRVVRPPVIFGEQVASKAALEWLDLVSDDLEGEGYAVGSADLCAASVGAFHIRQRLWFVAYAVRSPGQQIPGSSSCHEETHGGEGRHGGEQDGNYRLAGDGKDNAGPLADPHRSGRDRGTQDAGCEAGAFSGEPSNSEVNLLGYAGDPGLPPRELKTLAGAGRRKEGGAVEQSGGASGGLADAHERPGFGSEPRAEFGAVPAADEGVCAVADTLSPRLGGGDKRGLGEAGREVGEQEDGAGVADKSGDGCEDDGAMENFWSSAVWLPCRDGKWRATEPGVLPLAHGLSADMGCLRPGEHSPFRVIKDPKTGKSRGQAPWRVGMLKGYGNAIVPGVAAEFIRASTSTSQNTSKKAPTRFCGG